LGQDSRGCEFSHMSPLQGGWSPSQSFDKCSAPECRRWDSHELLVSEDATTRGPFEPLHCLISQTLETPLSQSPSGVSLFHGRNSMCIGCMYVCCSFLPKWRGGWSVHVILHMPWENVKGKGGSEPQSHGPQHLLPAEGRGSTVTPQPSCHTGSHPVRDSLRTAGIRRWGGTPGG
jgi:hypothetical protein